MKSLKNVLESTTKCEILSTKSANAIKGGDGNSTGGNDPWEKRKRPGSSNIMVILCEGDAQS